MRKRAILGYAVVTTCLSVMLAAIVALGLSSWLLNGAAIISVWMAYKYIDAMSVALTGVVVATFTAVFPLSLLQVIANYPNGPSVIAHMGSIDLIAFTLPTACSAVVSLHLKKRCLNRAK